jgi:hypothetical protein
MIIILWSSLKLVYIHFHDFFNFMTHDDVGYGFFYYITYKNIKIKIK